MRTRLVSIALLTATVGLVGLAPGAGAEVRVSPNFRLDSDPSAFRGRDQVALAVNPANPQHVVQVNANYLDLRCEASTSFNGGETWSIAVPLPPPAPTGIESPFAPSCRTYQSVEFGAGQNVYAIATAERTTPSFPDSSTLVFKSVDGGASWRPGVIAMAGGPGNSTFPTPGPSYSRPSLSVDAGKGAGGADRIYAVAQETTGTGNSGPPCPQTTPATRCFPVRTAVSNDGGQTFSAGVNASPQGLDTTDGPSKPVVNSDGSVTVAWRTFGVRGTIQAARSTDGGQTWGAPVDIATVTNTGTSTQTHVPPAAPSTAGVSASASYARMAGDPRSGNLYVVYNQGSTGPSAPAGGFQGADHFISPDSAVYFQRSRDQGRTWSTPKLISDRTQYPGSRLVQTRHPTVSVSPSGRVNIVWHDRRHWYQEPGERTCSHSHIFCEEMRLGDTYYSYSTNGGDSFSPNVRINDRSHNNEVGYDTRPSGYWNYGPQSVTVGGDQLLVGWMDSREGNWDTDTSDTYLAKVNFNATGAAPQTHIDQPDAVSRSVALSKLAYPAGNEGAMTGGPRDPAGPGGFGPATRNASAVVIVNEGDVAGALAGQVLARANPAPVLLSPSSGLPAGVRSEVSRMSPARAFVIGDAAKLSDQVVVDLAAAGVPSGQVTRLSGPSDAATAAAIAARFDQRFDAEKAAGVPAFDAAVIANPAGPDAAAVAGLAAARRLPILYVGTDSIPPETQAALRSLNIDKTLVVGGPSSVSGTVLGQLPSATRLGGADQYATSKAVVAESGARGLPGNVVYVADGSKPMDAALLGGVAARATGMLVLAPAPLSTTAAGQASEFGLNGISRSFLLGPPAPGAPAPGGTPPGAPPGGTPASPPVERLPQTDRVRPVLTGLRVSPARFRLGTFLPLLAPKAKTGTAVRFSVSEPATVRLTFAQRRVGRRVGRACRKATRALRKRKPCARFVTVSPSVTIRGVKRGANSVRFAGRLSSQKRALPAGRYRVTAVATDAAGNRSVPRTAQFRADRARARAR
ncbi:MAG: glycoside hydrolase [Actinomycetota bacterium]|nr:glycoside hydrolase [Actinomycetota bacterium]